MFKTSLCALAVVAASSSFAHDLMVLPSKSILSAVPANVAVDVTATHNVYRFDKAVSPDNVTVYGPDGKRIRDLGTMVKGATRTSFDLNVTEEGTYKITYGSSMAGYMTTYEVGERNTRKRLRGNQQEMADQIPADAKNIETTKMGRTGVTYITSKAPTDTVLKPSNKGFEMVPVTHPADYINGEEIEIKALMDGKPLAGAKVVVKAESAIYGIAEEPVEVSTDKSGVASFTLDNAGRYNAAVSYSGPSSDPLADKEAYTVFYTFEVVYE